MSGPPPPDTDPFVPGGAAGRFFVALLLAGAALRLAFVARPLDHRLRAPWRQADSFQIARNFAREDPSFLHPRIDWRGDTPGLVEMEAPILPWIGGMLFRVFGIHVQILRSLSCLAELLSLLLFAGLARRALPPRGAVLALAAYVFNPLLIDLATALQPEPLMLLLALAAVVAIERWNAGAGDAWLLLAGAALGGGILAKAPAACLGILLAWVVLRRCGLQALRRPAVWATALLALVPPVLWYAHAKRFFVLYGNSLGLSNEYPFLGFDMLWPPKFLLGLFKWETLGVVTPLGWILMVASWSAPWRVLERPLVWYGSVVAFLVVGARTTADDWAFYYHGLAVAPACLLMGLGFVALSEAWPGVAKGCAAATLVLLIGAAAYLLHARDNRPDLEEMRRCGLQFVTRIPPEGRIVTRGGNLRDDDGMPVAHNESMLFAWLDRRGFTYGNEELSFNTLERIRARGGRFWIAHPDETARPFIARARERYTELDSCPDGYALFDLGTPAAPGQDGAQP
ncbi:MAG TPA: glycosyltransferase family 39 protein [Candidatus Polarisedimenticolia bacterium]|nr:glycosyltransferase family 39 protein [Candidatus Polarisedimenticolia bacterium]